MRQAGAAFKIAFGQTSSQHATCGAFILIATRERSDQPGAGVLCYCLCSNTSSRSVDNVVRVEKKKKQCRRPQVAAGLVAHGSGTNMTPECELDRARAALERFGAGTRRTASSAVRSTLIMTHNPTSNRL